MPQLSEDSPPLRPLIFLGEEEDTVSLARQSGSVYLRYVLFCSSRDQSAGNRKWYHDVFRAWVYFE